jgi:hypothetical protein
MLVALKNVNQKWLLMMKNVAIVKLATKNVVAKNVAIENVVTKSWRPKMCDDQNFW